MIRRNLAFHIQSHLLSFILIFFFLDARTVSALETVLWADSAL